MRFLLFACLFFSQLVGVAQNTDKEYLSAYKKAVQSYANANYDVAIKEFLPLTQSRYNNPVVPFAHYYLALCANNTGNFYQSRNTLRQIFERFPEWKYIEEAYYLYAEANFGEYYYDEAFTYLSKIQSKSILKDSESMKFKHISEFTDITKLTELQKKFPTEPVIAEVILRKIKAKKNPSKAELRLSDELTKRYKLDNPTRSQPMQQQNSDDKILDIGVLLPFELQSFKVSETSRPNQYVYDMFMGMQLAKEKLKTENIDVNVYGFDIGKATQEIQNLTFDSNFKKLDLMVGPLYPQPNQVASAFAYKQNIVQIHPLSNNSELVTNEENVFLVQPSYTDQVNKVLDFGSGLNSKKNVAVYFGSSKKDSLFASIFQKIAIEKGYNCLEIKHLYENTVVNSSSSIGQIFVAANPDESLVMLRTLRKQKQNAPIFVTASSLNFEKTPKEILTNNLYILYPEFIDKTKYEVENFRATYIAKMSTFPSYFSYLGYDMVLFYGRMYKDGKNLFKENMKLIDYSNGYTLSGFDFTYNSNSNKIIPIIKYEDGDFKEVSR